MSTTKTEDYGKKRIMENQRKKYDDREKSGGNRGTEEK